MARGHGLLQKLGTRTLKLGPDPARCMAPARGCYRRLLPPARERVRYCLAQWQTDLERARGEPLPGLRDAERRSRIHAAGASTQAQGGSGSADSGPQNHKQGN